jgi:hypothetical protein
LKMNELGSFEKSEAQWYDIISQKNGVITHTSVKHQDREVTRILQEIR